MGARGVSVGPGLEGGTTLRGEAGAGRP
jgi:hypothetical protein